MLKTFTGILLFLWFIAEYLIDLITGYEWIPVIVTAIFFLDLFLLQTINLPKLLKKYNPRFFRFGISVWKHHNTKDKRFCTKITLNDFIKDLTKKNTKQIDTKKYESYETDTEDMGNNYEIKLAFIKSKNELKAFFKDINYFDIESPGLGF